MRFFWTNVYIIEISRFRVFGRSMIVDDEIEEASDKLSFSFCRSIPHSGLPKSKGFDK